MKAKVLRDFTMAGQSFKTGETIDIPDESIIRLSALVAPVETEAHLSVTERPPKDKSVKSNKILKKGKRK